MAGSTLTIKLNSNQAGTNSTTYTMSGTAKDVVAAQKFIQQLPRDGGLFDDNGVWWPVTAISSISIS